jgi:hypothetical protein
MSLFALSGADPGFFAGSGSSNSMQQAWSRQVAILHRSHFILRYNVPEIEKVSE